MVTWAPRAVRYGPKRATTQSAARDHGCKSKKGSCGGGYQAVTRVVTSGHDRPWPLESHVGTWGYSYSMRGPPVLLVCLLGASCPARGLQENSSLVPRSFPTHTQQQSYINPGGVGGSSLFNFNNIDKATCLQAQTLTGTQLGRKNGASL